jgi:hypothetical protein
VQGHRSGPAEQHRGRAMATVNTVPAELSRAVPPAATASWAGPGVVGKGSCEGAETKSLDAWTLRDRLYPSRRPSDSSHRSTSKHEYGQKKKTMNIS